MGRKEIKENSGHSGEKTKNRSGKIRSGNSTKKRKSRPMRVKGKIRTDQSEISSKNKQTKTDHGAAIVQIVFSTKTVRKLKKIKLLEPNALKRKTKRNSTLFCRSNTRNNSLPHCYFIIQVLIK